MCLDASFARGGKSMAKDGVDSTLKTAGAEFLPADHIQTDYISSAPVGQYATSAQGAAFDGVITEYGDFATGTTVAAVAVASGAMLTDYTLSDGAPFDGSADANGRFDIVIRYTGDQAYASYFEAARVRWEQIITGDIPDSSHNGTFVDDLLIDADVSFLDA